MGFYLNPPLDSNESFLREYGSLVLEGDQAAFEKRPKGELPVVWVDCGDHTAAAVSITQEEHDFLTNPRDARTKKVYYVGMAILLTVVNEKDFTVKMLKLYPGELVQGCKAALSLAAGQIQGLKSKVKELETVIEALKKAEAAQEAALCQNRF